MTTTERSQVYKCNSCGHIVSVMHKGAKPLVCCGQPMQFMDENSVDASKEKHVPVIEKTELGYKVIVGSVAHPMLPEHYIEWIELIADNEVYTKFLNPGDAPEAIFTVKATSVIAKAYCNLHGNWKNN